MAPWFTVCVGRETEGRATPVTPAQIRADQEFDLAGRYPGQRKKRPAIIEFVAVLRAS
jgi:hypothetical protein